MVDFYRELDRREQDRKARTEIKEGDEEIKNLNDLLFAVTAERDSLRLQLEAMSKPVSDECSHTPWRSVYPLGTKARCAAISAGDHYVMLYVAKPDDTDGTVRMHQANADLIVQCVNILAARAKGGK